MFQWEVLHLILGCVKIMGCPKYLAANCLGLLKTVVFRGTLNRLTLLKGYLWKKVIYCAARRKLWETWVETTCAERGKTRRGHVVSNLRSLALLQWLLTLDVPSVWLSMIRASNTELEEWIFLTVWRLISWTRQWKPLCFICTGLKTVV